MNVEVQRYRRAKEIFLAAHERDPADCAAFVAEQCGSDTELRAEVEALLADDRTWGATLDRLDQHAVPPLPPAYRALRELGHGGMGVVWLAERDTGDFRQRVALKLLAREALRDPERHARFRAERRILASLDHPHIARLLDGGALADGTPYLAMEYVEGERLDQWVERKRPALTELLSLFIAICRAVQAAHQRLVVHRDLKPANILVDAYGEPKLLDFGIAKLLDDTTGDTQFATGTGMQLLTPRYAAPEQVRGEAVTTATDVYALGVILYELLTGRSPYGAVSAAAPEQLRAICDTDPVRPSLALSSGETTTVATSGARLRGDIDAILLKCLRKPPRDRYGGAGELADDLQAFLDGRPVAARAGSTRYALAKYVSRHRYLVASTLTVVAVLAAASLLLLRQLDATRTQRDLAAQERDKAEQVTAFLVDLLRNADPSKAKGLQVSVREALDRGEADLDRRLRDHADTKAHLLGQLSLIHGELGNPTHSLELAEQAMKAADATPGVGAEERSALLYAHAVALTHNGRGKEALPELLQVEREAAASGNRLRQAEAVIQQGMVFQTQLESAKATERNNQAQSLLLATLQVPDMTAAKALASNEAQRPFLERLANLGQSQCATLVDARKIDAARDSCLSTAELKHALWPPDDPAHLNTQSTRATLAAITGDRQGALRMRRELLDGTRKVFGEDHTRTAYAEFNLGVSLKDGGELAEAESLYRSALTTLRKQLGAEHRSTLVVQNNLANLLMETRHFDEALTLHQQTLTLRRRALGEKHADVAQSLMNLAQTESAMAQHTAALRDGEAALAAYKNVLGAEHHDTVLARAELAQFQLAAGRAAEAEKNASAALAAYEHMGEAPAERGWSRFLLAQAIWDLGRKEEALTLARQSLEEAKEHAAGSFRLEDVQHWLAAHGPAAVH